MSVYPNHNALGELAYCGGAELCNTPPEPLPQDERPLQIVAAIIADESDPTPWGHVQRPVTLRNTDPYAYYPADRRHGKGHFYADENERTPWGPLVRAVVPIGCKPTTGTIRPGDFDEAGILADRTGFARYAKLETFADQAEQTPWGPVVRRYGNSHCDPYSGGLGAFYVDLFGTVCAYCPTMFMTAQPPCLGCSYDPAGGPDPYCGIPHSTQSFDSCGAGGWVDVGEATCRAPRYAGDPATRESCDVSAGPVFGDNHCESCVYQRLTGWLANVILARTDALSKIPMRPSNNPYGAPCPYGCGKFGWTMWHQGLGLRIPYDFLGPDEELTIIEAPCTYPGARPCFNPSVPIWESGYNFCGDGLSCACNDEFDLHVTSTHEMRWKSGDPRNRIDGATVCFAQRELCDPANGPCDSNPVQDPLHYNNPSSTTIVDVNVRIKITLVFDHWGPRGAAGGGGCGGCRRLGFDVPPRDLVVEMVGEWCGPIAWGSVFAHPWPGYPATPPGGPYPGKQNETDPASTYPSSFCGGLFMDQGRYDDGADTQSGIEPRKRCSSWVGGGGQFPKFWCAPHLNWRFSFSQSSGQNNWGPIDQPNQHQRRKECWAVQPIKIAGRCQQGSVDATGISPCDTPDCRRGCSVRDDSSPFVSPCAGPQAYRFRATPWGCGQCQQPAPIEAP